MDQGLVLFFGSMLDTEYWHPLRDAGYRLGILYDRSGFYRPAVPPEFSVAVEADFLREPDQLVAHLRAIRDTGNLAAVVNIDELRIRQWADACAELGVTAISPHTATLVRSKTEMRRTFDRLLPAASTRWAVVTGAADVRRFARTVGGPVVLKPDGLWGSFFVGVHPGEAQAVAGYEELRHALPAYYAAKHLFEPPTILVEEFIAGTNHSVDCVIGPDGIAATPVVDVLTGEDVGGADLHHFARVLPSALGAEEQRSVRRLATEAVAALGMEVGVAHVEIIHSPDGPRLVEVAARPGANRPFLLREATGIDLMRSYVDVLGGRAPDLRPTRAAAAAVVTPFPTDRGTLVGLPGLGKVEALPSVRDVLVRARPGSDITLRRDGTGAAPLRLVLASDDPDRLRADLAEIARVSPVLFDVAPSEGPGAPAAHSAPHPHTDDDTEKEHHGYGHA